MITVKRFSIVLLTFLFLAPAFVKASEAAEGKKFNPGEMIMHHIKDDYTWHFATVGHTHIGFSLPVIIYSPSKGFDMFMSSKFHHGETAYKGYRLDHGKVISEDGREFYDFSITKNVASMFLSAAILLFLFISIGNAYKKNSIRAPKGIQSFMEPIIVFLKDEVIKPTLGHKYERYLPFLLTVFFFIWINNMLGLLPGAANVTGNIAVTLCLAAFTFLITNLSGNKNYWGHIFNPPGVPKWILPLMMVVEFIGIFTKPFALMIRLFANITAGHIIILSIISLIFIFGDMSKGLGFGVSPISVAFGVFLFSLELLVAVIQAYIFTMLSAVFISQAIEEHH